MRALQPWVEYTTDGEGSDVGSSASGSNQALRAAGFRENMSNFLAQRSEQSANKIKLEEKRAENETKKLELEEKRLELENQRLHNEAKRAEDDSKRNQAMLEMLTKLVADRV